MSEHTAENDAPRRGRWLHAHLRSCAIQEWFQDGSSGDVPDCTCDGPTGATAKKGLRRPEPCEHETQGSEQPDTCPYCAYLKARYDGWEPWEDATWD